MELGLFRPPTDVYGCVYEMLKIEALHSIITLSELSSLERCFRKHIEKAGHQNELLFAWIRVRT